MIERHGSARTALDRLGQGGPEGVDAATCSAAVEHAMQNVRDLERLAGVAVTPDDPVYPRRLLELYDPPAVLFACGTFESAAGPAVAIVGTRNPSSYGLQVARATAATCARAGVAVVSGLARGIDAAAHEGALEGGGRTVAVLGTGIDIAYPRMHKSLQDRIAHEGLLLTEQLPGDRGHAGTFPKRNRLIAALADVTVVVEAGDRSGALITADHAMELGRTVACVPNAINVVSARGSNALLKAHAEPVLSPDDVLALLRITAPPTPGPILDGVSAACWDAVQEGACTPAEVARMTRMSTREAIAALALLEVEGLLTVDLNGCVRTAPIGN